MNQKQKIIIAYHRDKKSQRMIAREVGLNRRTVARYIKDYYQKRAQLLARADDTQKEGVTADIIQTPSYDATSRKRVKLNEEILNRIQFYLQQSEQKKKINIFKALQEEGFAIGYTTICNTIRKIQREYREAYIRQEYAQGEVCEFDWGEVKLTIAGKSRICQIAVFSSTWGDYRHGELYANQKTESFSDSHVSFFEAIGGVYREMVYDNARVMVAKFVGHSEKEPTEALLKLSLYYGFCFRFTNSYQTHEKGHVECSVEYLRRKIFSKCDTFASIACARAYFQRELSRLNAKSLKDNKSAFEMLEKEKNHLLVLPSRYDTARITEAQVDKYSSVSVDTNHYSVPDHLVGEFVLVKIYPDQILCYHNQEKIASHKRYTGRNHWQLDINHYLKTLKFKLGALKRSSAFSQLKMELKEIYRKYYQGQERQYLQLLELVATHSLSKVSQTITMLEKIPTMVNTEKIRLILEKKDEPVPILAPCAITKKAQEILSHYSKLLGGIRV